MKTIKVTGSKMLDDGVHEGAIIEIQERTEPYEYVDLIIESEGSRVKAGYPATINPVSNLGKLLTRFGVELKIDEEIDVEKTLVGKKVKFQTMTEERDGMKFSKVISTSVKPME